MDNFRGNPQSFESPGLCSPHAGFIPRLGMVMPEQMQNAMYHQELHFAFKSMTAFAGLFACKRKRNDHVAQITTAGFRIRFVSRKGKHIREGIMSEEIPVKHLNVRIIHQHDG